VPCGVSPHLRGGETTNQWDHERPNGLKGMKARKEVHCKIIQKVPE